MLIAHLPSGYILGRFAQARWCQMVSGVVTAAMAGSVLPDIDMLYFHLVDGGRTHHHAYISHWPLFWVAAGVLSLSLGRLFGSTLTLIGVFFAGAMLHMVLDTVASPIMWLAPFDRHAFEFVTVPARYGNWFLSFILHWTFALELVICTWALWLGWLRPPLPVDAPQKGT
ncbi:MAG: metal-dependent hydrolase [Mesorhizobium sp.]|uniref:metal-dependent hydrolase n=1 Tax=Mesorhizobium sp. TaxID=1871066 RepID=UPI00120C9FA0|nr:metal-dependent hydrolase [Mesorhizobium sp.]TIO51467.1 MAG: metal-dependent hydrolase [Mesorhizobium sp.]TIO59646.1 MAG: metal-dependent hydrolase [Mesorhizobium sp.]TJV64914.1 MAG: metal-dependent hydrolase [Mesorhizobium sp.]